MEKEGATKTRRKKVYNKKKSRLKRSVHDRLRLKETRLLDELEGAKAERDAALLKLAKNPLR